MRQSLPPRSSAHMVGPLRCRSQRMGVYQVGAQHPIAPHLRLKPHLNNERLDDRCEATTPSDPYRPATDLPDDPPFSSRLVKQAGYLHGAKLIT